jgi:hypothetical protein
MSRKQTAKLVDPTLDGATDAARKKHRPRFPIPFNTKQLMMFQTWIAPPIGFDLSGIDPNNSTYLIGIMNVFGGGRSLNVPFTAPAISPPIAAPGTVWQFQMIGVAGTSDPTTLKYYQTMAVTPGPLGSQSIWTRIFTPPQSAPGAGVPTVLTANLPDASPATIQVSGVPGFPGTWVYHHVVITPPPPNPIDFFLQQPLT